MRRFAGGRTQRPARRRSRAAVATRRRRRPGRAWYLICEKLESRRLLAGMTPDRFEANDTLATATELGMVAGELTVSDLSIDSDDDVDVFRFATMFEGRDDHAVLVRFSHAAGNLQARLVSAWGFTVREWASDATVDYAWLSLWGLPAGTYCVEVSGNSGAVNAYSLEFHTPGGPEIDKYEFNDTLATAEDLGPTVGGRTESGLSIHAAGNPDFFRFTTRNDGTAADFVDVRYARAIGDLDARLLDARGDVLRTADATADGERLSLEGLPADTYWIEVRGVADAVNTYALALQAPAARPDRFEDNDTLETAAALGTLAGRLTVDRLSLDDWNEATGSEVDFFRFATVAPGASHHTITLRTDTSLSTFGGTAAELTLFDELGTVIRDGFGTGNTVSLSLEDLPAGSYAVRVQGFRSSFYGGDFDALNYSLSFQAPAPIALGELGDSPRMAFGESRRDAPAEYTFEARPGDLVSVGVRGQSSAADFGLTLFDASTADPSRQPRILSNDDAAPTTRDPALDFVVPPGGGIYRLLVTSGSNDNPRFTLTVGRQAAAFTIAGHDATARHDLTVAGTSRLRLDAGGALGGAAQLALYDDRGRLVTTSGASGVAGPARIDQVVLPGRYAVGTVGRATQPIPVSVDIGPVPRQVEDFEVGAVPAALAVVDLDGDGWSDIVTANRDDGTVSVLLGTGGGSFGEERTFVVGPNPIALATADVDGDGRMDIVVASSADYDSDADEWLAGTVSVLLGTSAGSFAAARTFPAVPNPSDLSLADVDRDGRIDIVLANWGGYGADGQEAPGTVSILRNAGDGTFSAHSEIVVGNGVAALATTDVDGDGCIDVVATYDARNFPWETWESFADTIGVLLGGGDGSFTMVRSYEVGENLTDVAAADFDGDGQVDLVATNGVGGGNVHILLGRGDGTFSQDHWVRTEDYPQAVTTADLDRDGHADIVVAGSRYRTLSILLCHGDGTFAAARTLAMEAEAVAVALADVDGDGRSDIVTVNASSDTSSDTHGTVSIRLGNGDGSFDARKMFAAGDYPQALATADFNGDGRMDVVTAGSGSFFDEASQDMFVGSFSILLGNGDGSYARRRTFGTHGDPLAIATADVNGDGRVDIVLANRGETSDIFAEVAGSIAILLGIGDGTFVEHGSFGVGRYPSAVTAADIDGDGMIDIITANRAGGTVSILRGNGDGSFAEQRAHDVGNEPMDVTTADFDGDGSLDIAVANAAPWFFDDDEVVGGVSVLLHGRDASFGPRQTYAVAGHPTAIATADVDGDGRSDLVTANRGSRDSSSWRNGSLVVFRGTGDGTFTSNGSVDVGGEPVGIATADFDGDGRIDVVMANWAGDSVSIFLGDGTGTFTGGQPFGVGAAPVALGVADVDGDGRSDVVTANSDDGTVTVLRNAGTGTFAARPNVQVGDYPQGVVTADVDGDGRPDIVTGNYSDATASILLGTGNGEFRSHVTAMTNAYPTAVATADFDRDGRADLALGHYDGDEISILLGRGGGTFATWDTVEAGRNPQALTVADLDGDGRPDIVVANSAYDSVSVLLGRGDGTFAARRVLDVGDFPVAVTTADVDGDGWLDVVTINDSPWSQDPSSLSVMLGTGAGGFRAATTVEIGGDPGSIATADVDGDGRIDILTTDFFGNAVTMLRGRGDGTFAAGVSFPVGDGPTALATADVDGDGRIDLVTADYASNTVSVMLGNGDGSFRAPAAFAAGGSPGGITTADVDGDGRIDLVVTNSGDDTVSILLGNGDGTFVDSVLRRGVRMQVVGPGSVTNPASQAVAMARINATGTLDTLALDRSGTVNLRYDADATTHGVRRPADQPADGPRGTGFDAAPLAMPAGPARIAVIDTRRESLFVGMAGSDGDLVIEQVLRAAAPEQPTDPLSALSRIARATGAHGDLNGDGYGDLVVSNPGAGTIDVLVTGPGGGFDDTAWQRLTAGTGPIAVLVVDVDRDGVADLVAANQVSGDLSVRLGVHGIVGASGFTAVAGFGPEFRYRTSPLVYGYEVDGSSGRGTAVALRRLSDIDLGDVNGDGDSDIVATSSEDGAITILLGLRDGAGRWAGFGPPARHRMRPGTSDGGEPAGLEDVALGDFDRDGRVDIALLDRGRQRILVHTSGSAAHDFDRRPLEIDLGGVIPKSVQVADVAGPRGGPDGVPDLVVGNDFGDVLTLQGRGDGSFETVRRADRTVALIAADLDGDGREELVYGNRGLDRVVVERAQAARLDDFRKLVEKNRAEGVLGPSAVAVVTEPETGLRHLIVVNGGSNSVLLFRQTQDAAPGDDVFERPETFFVGTNPTAVAVGDVDGDGVPDVVVTNSGSNDLSVLKGRMAAERFTLGAGLRLSSGGRNPERLVLADLVDAAGRPAADGRLDIAVTNRGSDSAAILRGIAGGFFNDRSPTFLPITIRAPGPIVTLPRPGGASPFIVVGSAATNQFQLLGQSGGGYRVSQTSSLGGAALATTSRDGASYLAAGNSATGSVSIFLGGSSSLQFFSATRTSLPGLTSLAFDSGGRLFGVSPTTDGTLGLFRFEASGSEGSATTGTLSLLAGAQAFVTRLVFTPLTTAGVGLVAALVTSEGVALADRETAGPDDAGFDDASGDAGGGEPDDNANEDAQPGAEEREEELESNPLLDFVLEVDARLPALNRRLMKALLERVADELRGLKITDIEDGETNAGPPATDGPEAAAPAERPDRRVAPPRPATEPADSRRSPTAAADPLVPVTPVVTTDRREAIPARPAILRPPVAVPHRRDHALVDLLRAAIAWLTAV